MGWPERKHHQEAGVKPFFQLCGSLVLAFVTIVCTPVGAFAQGYGTISGRVTDATELLDCA